MQTLTSMVEKHKHDAVLGYALVVNEHFVEVLAFLNVWAKPALGMLCLGVLILTDPLSQKGWLASGYVILKSSFFLCWL